MILIPEECMKCKLTLEKIVGCIDCLRVMKGLPKLKKSIEYEILN